MSLGAIMQETTGAIVKIPVELIRAGANDRTQFDQTALQELADSIAKNGIAQPPTVRPMADGTYQLIAGERRTRAMRDILHWQSIDVRILECDDDTASALMLAENTARADLDPIDEGAAYQKRINTGATMADIAKIAGVSTTRVKNRLALLTLRPELQKLVRDKQLTVGYAQIIADGNLDTNRQMMAVRDLQANDHPTPGWLRNRVNELVTQQAQDGLFGMFAGQECQEQAPVVKRPDPPVPGSVRPPRKSSMADTLKSHAAFWLDAARQWDALGRVTKRNECLAAAHGCAETFACIYGRELDVQL